MSLYSFVDRLRQPSDWLPEQQWAQWCLIAVAASVFFLLLLKIVKRRRRQTAGAVHVDHFNQSAPISEATYTRGMDSAQTAGRDREQRIRTDPTELVAYPEISIRQLRREIFKRDQAEARLEHEIEELKIANKQLRQKITESKEKCAYFEKKVAELTAANKLMDRPSAEKEVEAEATESPRKEASRPREADKGEKVDQKQCRKCKKHKPLTEFHKNASSHDGLARWCKSCKTRAAKESRQKRAAARRAVEQQADMCADAPLCVLHHRQTDRLKNARRRAGHAAYKIPDARQSEHRSHRFRSQLSSPGLRCPRRQKQREQGNSSQAQTPAN
ncbi:MAG: hypothetical protein JSW59_13545 [Phycisphaerales bacterium]|nr:MAG: hypothetical protein JSW59_13545 [Phycisphaerales bacterium]